MKKTFRFCVVLPLIFVACIKNNPKNFDKEVDKTTNNYDSFGNKITLENVISANKMLTTFNTLQMGDTVHIKFASKINDVCSKKGCWMKLGIDKEETMVRFKDYGFFVPLDSKNKEVIVDGKAFLKITSVKELQHYAADAGKSKEEIASITKPKKKFAFEASGVLIKVK